MIKVLSLDPAGKKFGVAGIQFKDFHNGDVNAPLSPQELSIYMHHVIESPASFDSSQRTQYMAHAAATIIGIDRPEVVVSEKPWGIGFSKDSLLQLIGALKAEIWREISWQGISEARRNVLGDSWGGATKQVTANWLLQYPWDLKSKRLIKSLIERANPKSDDGYDVLDAILHALCYLISERGLQPVKKEKKKRGKKSDA